MAEQRKKVESCVIDIISTLREARITVEEFRGDESQATLFRLLNNEGMIGQFRQLDQLVSSDQSFDPEIPTSILDYIDKGVNPDLFIKEMRSSGLHETEQVKSKMVSLAAFSQALETQLAAAWPDLDLNDTS